MNNSSPFVPGQLYHRRNDLHGKYKGQERGGIITPARFPLIFIVSGSAGHQHGYTDHWSHDRKLFYYYGEGLILPGASLGCDTPTGYTKIWRKAICLFSTGNTARHGLDSELKECLMSRRMRPLPTKEEWVLELLAGNADGVVRGTVTQRQLKGTRDMALRWGIDPLKVDTTIANKKAPPRAGEI